MLILTSIVFGVTDAVSGQWSHAAFTLVTGAGMLYAIIAFIGVRECVDDVRLGISRTAGSLADRIPAYGQGRRRTSE